MQTYLKQLIAQMETDPIMMCENQKYPTLDVLYFHYAEYQGIQSDLARQLNRKISDLLDNLPFDDGEQVSCLIGELAAEHERTAFVAGLRLGAQFMLELRKEGM